MDSSFSINFTSKKNVNSFYIMDSNNYSLLKNGIISKLKFILEQNVKKFNILNNSSLLVNDFKNSFYDNLMSNEIGIITDLNVRVKESVNKKSIVNNNISSLDEIFNECMMLKKNIFSANKDKIN